MTFFAYNDFKNFKMRFWEPKKNSEKSKNIFFLIFTPFYIRKVLAQSRTWFLSLSPNPIIQSNSVKVWSLHNWSLSDFNHLYINLETDSKKIGTRLVLNVLPIWFPSYKMSDQNGERYGASLVGIKPDCCFIWLQSGKVIPAWRQIWQLYLYETTWR